MLAFVLYGATSKPSEAKIVSEADLAGVLPAIRFALTVPGDLRVTIWNALENLETLSFNEISDLESLSELLNLKTLSLDNNQIVGISPLLSNTGLRHFDIVSLLSNPLHEEALSEQVTALRSIGV